MTLHEGQPPEALCPLQVGRTWTTAVVSWCRTCTSGTGSAPSAPSASGEKQVAREPLVPLLPSRLRPWSPWSPAAPRSAMRADLLFKDRVHSRSSQRDGWGGRHSCLRVPTSFCGSLFCCPALLSWVCPSLTCYVSFFVANENEDCSALTNEIIVTMHTFQDVSCSRGAGGQGWGSGGRGRPGSGARQV